MLLGRVVFFVHFALCAVVECQKEYLACDEVLAVLCVWSKMQIFCVWSIRCYCPPKPHYLASLKFRMVLRSLYRLTQVILQYDLGLEYDLGEQLNGQLNGWVLLLSGGPDAGDSDKPGQVVWDDETDGVSYNYTFFHLSLFFASLYIMMTLTHWYRLVLYSLSLRSRR